MFKDLFDGLFDNLFGNVGKLFKYKWNGKFVNSLVPSGSMAETPDDVSKDIKKGSVFIGIYGICAFLSAMIMMITISNQLGVFGSLLGNSWKAEIIKEGVTDLAITVGGAALLIALLTGKKKRSESLYFGSLILVLVYIIHLVIQFFDVFETMDYSFLAGLVLLAGILVGLLGSINVIVGSIDFCLVAKKKESREEKKEPKEEPKKKTTKPKKESK